MPKLTVGMACYDDFDGVYFSVQSLRMYHSDIMNDIEILVVDNNPNSDIANSAAISPDILPKMSI